MAEEKFQCLNPHGKQGTNIAKHKYEQVKEVVLEVIASQQPIAFVDMAALASEILQEQNFEGKPMWYVTTVKLDLEARKLIERVPKTSPHQLKLCGL